jgi:hypothetical protein
LWRLYYTVLSKLATQISTFAEVANCFWNSVLKATLINWVIATPRKLLQTSVNFSFLLAVPYIFISLLAVYGSRVENTRRLGVAIPPVTKYTSKYLGNLKIGKLARTVTLIHSINFQTSVSGSFSG